MRARRLRPLAAVLVASILAITSACSDDSGNDGADDDGGSSDTAAGEVPAELQAILDKGYEGTWTEPPTEGPAAQEGKKVWVISCGQVAASCADIANSAVEAGEALGWDVTLFDGKLDPSNYSNGILQAIAADVDGIFTGAIDCSVALGPLQQAKEAGITTVSVSGFDCDDELQNTGDPIYSTFVKYTGIDTYGKTYDEWGAMSAAWLAGITGGKAKVVRGSSPGYLVTLHQNAGFDEALKLCPDCEMVEDLGITAADQAGTAAQQKIQQAITQHADANSVKINVGGWFARFVDAALRATGRDDLNVVGAECDDTAIAAIKGDGPLDACIHRSLTWESWAAMDAMNRQFAEPGSEPVDEGLGFQIVDKDHNVPDGDSYEVPIDFKALYQEVWGA